MSCSPFDIREYVFGELDREQGSAVESHIRACSDCSRELERLRVTETALFSLRDEELPRRIAFVSDPILEPRWWQRWWNSGPRLGFASAAMLSVAILVHGLYRQPAPAVPAPVAPVIARQEPDAAAMQRQIREAVAEAVASLEAEQQVRLARTVQQVERRYAALRQDDLQSMEASLNLYNQKQKHRYVTLMQQAGGPQ